MLLFFKVFVIAAALYTDIIYLFAKASFMYLYLSIIFIV